MDGQMDRRTDRQNDYCNPRCACAPRVNKKTLTLLFEFVEVLVRLEPPPCLLDLAGKAVVLPFSELLQQKQLQRRREGEGEGEREGEGEEEGRGRGRGNDTQTSKIQSLNRENVVIFQKTPKNRQIKQLLTNTLTYSLGTLDKDFGFAKLPLVRFHVDGHHEMLDALYHRSIPVGVRLRGQDAVAVTAERVRSHKVV